MTATGVFGTVAAAAADLLHDFRLERFLDDQPRCLAYQRAALHTVGVCQHVLQSFASRFTRRYSCHGLLFEVAQLERGQTFKPQRA